MNREKTDASLGERMKEYEERSTTLKNVEPFQSFAVRLDGTGFSKLTKELPKPFDRTFTWVMIKTMNDLVVKFGAKTGYTHSDEITLVFPALYATSEAMCAATCEKGRIIKHLYGGRVMKLCSTMAAYCSVRFNHYWREYLADPKHAAGHTEKTITKLTGDEATFDARVIMFDVGLADDMVNLLYWRSVRDCYRTAVMQYARMYYHHSKLHKKNSREMIEMMKADHGFDWTMNVPLYWKHGIYAKYSVSDSGSRVIENRSFRMRYSEGMVGVVFADAWPAVETMDIAPVNTVRLSPEYTVV